MCMSLYAWRQHSSQMTRKKPQTKQIHYLFLIACATKHGFICQCHSSDPIQAQKGDNEHLSYLRPPTQEKLTRESCTITFQQLQRTLKKCGCQSMICVWYVIFSQNIHTVHSKLYALNVRKMWADALHS